MKNSKFLHILKLIGLWYLTSIFILGGLGFLSGISGILFLIAGVLLAPIPKWQEFLAKYLKKKIKVLIIIALVILGAMILPSTDTPANEITPSGTTVSTTETTTSTESVIDATQSTTVPKTEPAIESTTNSTTQAPTEPTSAPTTTPTTEPTQPVHTHNFSAATCTSPKTCACGATEGSAKGHNWQSATCTKAKTCTSCDITEGTTAAHNWEDATHTSPKTCTNCGITEGEPLEKPGEENYHGHVYTGGSSSKKYHYEENCAGKYSHEITWEEVDNRDLEPCKTCVLQ